MNLGSIARIAAVCCVGMVLGQAWGQDKIGVPGAQVFFDSPSEKAPVDWGNSCLAIVTRAPGPLTATVDRTNYASIQMKCAVRSSSINQLPAKIEIHLGWNNPPDLQGATVPDRKRSRRIDEQFPADQNYLVLLTKPPKTDWSELKGSLVPRLFIPVEESIQLAAGAGKVAILTSIFDDMRTCSHEDDMLLSSWLRDEWRTEEIPALKQTAPIIPADRRLSAISHDPESAQIGAAALLAANQAYPTAKTYLTLLAGMWGCEGRFKPFFDACAAFNSRADAGVLESMVDDPKFGELSVEEAIGMARLTKPELAGVYFSFVTINGNLTKDQRLKLYLQSLRTLRSQDRYRIYVLMLTGLPGQLGEEFPNGLCPPYKMDGSIPNETAYRQKWDSYLGISTIIKT